MPDDWSDLATGTGTPSWSKTESYGDVNALAIHAGASGSGTEEVANDGLAPYLSSNHYTADGYVHTEGLGGDTAYIAIQALNSSGNVLGMYNSNKVGLTGADSNHNVAWTHVMVDI